MQKKKKKGNEQNAQGSRSNSNGPAGEQSSPKKSQGSRDVLTTVRYGRGIDDESRGLLWAVANGRDDIAGTLLIKGADVSIKDAANISVLHVAARDGHAAIVKLLLEAGADVSEKDVDTQATALHRAAERGHDTCVRILLEAGADIDARNVNGMTPLHKAARSGHGDVVHLLLQHGAPYEGPIEVRTPGQSGVKRSLASDNSTWDTYWDDSMNRLRRGKEVAPDVAPAPDEAVVREEPEKLELHGSGGNRTQRVVDAFDKGKIPTVAMAWLAMD